MTKTFENQDKINALIKEARVCRLAVTRDSLPYIVPLSFGFKDNTLYFHSGPKGEKLRCIRENPGVCFEFDKLMEIVENESPCAWDMQYQSIVGFGKARILEDVAEKTAALNIIIAQYTDRAMEIPEKTAAKTVVIEVKIDTMTYKENLI